MRIRLAWYVKEVVPLFVLGTLVLFFLDRWGALRVLERIASPVVRGWLGLPGEATGAFLIGFLRRDYGAAGLYRLQKAGLLNLRQVTVSLVVVTLFMPCIAQWFIMVKERGLRSALGMTAIVGAVALGVSCAVNAGLNACPWILGR
jgi:ferrous iron transport protein B